MAHSLKGKVAFVTGGSRGIGAAIAKHLAREGASVAITFTSQPDKADAVVKAIRADGGKAIAIKAEASDADAVTAAVARAAKEFGGLDILVNNAAIASFAPVGEFALSEFDRMFAINVRAVFVAVQAALAHMGEGGRIINIGSVNADSMPIQGGAIYAMTKAAMAGLTRGMARDLGPRGITVNVVQPGPIDTDMNPATGPFADLLMKYLAVPRYAQVDEVAAFVTYLAGPQAGYITGSGLNIDGGFDA